MKVRIKNKLLFSPIQSSWFTHKDDKMYNFYSTASFIFVSNYNPLRHSQHNFTSEPGIKSSQCIFNVAIPFGSR